MAITNLPSLDRTAATFRDDVDTFFATSLPNFTSELNTEIARINGIGAGAYSATSTTSLTIGTGSKSLTVETGKSFVVGQPVMIASTASPTNYMVGQVTAYNSGTGAMTVDVTSTQGSGTIAAWTVSVAATVLSGVSPDSIVVLTSGTTWTCPAGVTRAIVKVQGAGGGGGASGATSSGGFFGAGGGTAISVITLTPGNSYAYSIGAGGAGGSIGGNGSVGGATTFTANAITYTGNGGGGGPYSGAIGAGGSANNGQINITGNSNGATATGYGNGGRPGNPNTGAANGGSVGGDGAIILELYK